jgi:hypothetical protein
VNGTAHNYGDAVAFAPPPPAALQPTPVNQGQCTYVQFPDGSIAAQIAIANTACAVADSVLNGSDTAKGGPYNAAGFSCAATAEGAGSPWASAWIGTYYAYSCANGSEQVAFNWGPNYNL